MAAEAKFKHILGLRVDSTRYAEAVEQVVAWAQAGQSEYVCAANVHMVMEAYDAPDYRRQVNEAGLVVPDGVPLAWALRLMGFRGQGRVYGPELMMQVCRRVAELAMPIGLFGGHSESLQLLQAHLTQRFPRLDIRFAYSPPFRLLTPEEETEVIRRITDSGARILFVGLGCPKQERWMARHKGRVGAVMLGVGAAFDFHSGRVRQAPPWMQRSGLEWLFRLQMEPRRLWKRYLKNNPRFVLLLSLQLLGIRVVREV